MCVVRVGGGGGGGGGEQGARDRMVKELRRLTAAFPLLFVVTRLCTKCVSRCPNLTSPVLDELSWGERIHTASCLGTVSAIVPPSSTRRAPRSSRPRF